MNREERRRAASIEATATKTREVVATLTTVANITVDADNIDFNRSYTFEIEDYGRKYRWTGARANRVDDMAVFDYQDGKNGVLTDITDEKA